MVRSASNSETACASLISGFNREAVANANAMMKPEFRPGAPRDVEWLCSENDLFSLFVT
jgi:hypothetical protein